MKEQLEIEHIAPRLPYGLRLKTPKGYDKLFVSNMVDVMTYMNEHESYYYKPILHPLSDLTKEIEHNGERFVPLNEINNLGYGEVDIDLEIEFQFKGCEWVWYSLMDGYTIIKQLHQWHFDTDGLIEKGLAIDVNTLDENPYKYT